MNLLRSLCVVILGLTLCMCCSAFAQEEKHDQDARPAQDDKRPDQDVDRDAKRPQQEQKQEERQDEHRDKKEVQEQRRTEERHEVREEHRIPDAEFRAHFGHEHVFHIGHPVIVEGRPRFHYGNYWFVFVDPWPVGWNYDRDDVYVDYVDGGYFLFSPVHPGVRVAVTVAF